MKRSLLLANSEGMSDDGVPSGSLNELTRRNVEAVAQLEDAATARRSRADRVADYISSFVGSMSFVYIHVAWFAVWILCNTASVVPPAWHFDPYPYTFLTFVVSLEAIFLSTFILISQNHEELLARRRNHLDLQINLLSEQENSQILRMLSSIERHLKICEDDPQAHALEEPMEPEKIIEQIENSIESGAQNNSKRQS